MAQTKYSAKRHAAGASANSVPSTSKAVRSRPGTPGYKWPAKQRRKFIATMKAKHQDVSSPVAVARTATTSAKKSSSVVVRRPYHRKSLGVLPFGPAVLLRQVETDLYDMLKHHQIKKFNRIQLKTLLAAAEDE